MITGAYISDCGLFRYSLWRIWDMTGELPRILWVMLNPSWADASTNDRTVLAIMDFSKRWGFGGLEIVNLYAYRTESPAKLKAEGFPIGPQNDWYIKNITDRCSTVVAAWGGNAQPERADHVRRIVDKPMHFLKINADGTPQHPLYVKRSTALQEWLW